MTSTNAQRQAAFRAQRAAEGLTEVRGIYARTNDHAKIKRYAKGMTMTNRVTVPLDVGRDLNEAAMDASGAAVADFVAAYRRAAWQVAEDRGLDITVVECETDSPEWHRITRQQAGWTQDSIGELWQAIHDAAI